MKHYEVLKIIVESAEDNILNAETLFRNLGFTDKEIKKIVEVIKGVREFDTIFETWIQRKMAERHSINRLGGHN